MNVLMLSGGQDSVAMLFKCLDYPDKYPIDKVIFCDTEREFPYMYEYLKIVNERLKPHNLSITYLNNNNAWDKWSKGTMQRGQYVGRVRGFPLEAGMSWCTRELKVYPVEKYLKQFNNVTRYIGIAVDEPKRIKKDGGIVYPLVELKLTEADCLQYTKDINLYNKLYNQFKRLGCWCCPKQNQGSIKVLINEYPELWSKIVTMEKYFIDKKAVIPTFKIKGSNYYEELNK